MADFDDRPRQQSLCACGRPAVWERTPARPEDAPEHAVCLLTDADFAEDYCDACFAQQVPPRAAPPLAAPPGETDSGERCDD